MSKSVKAEMAGTIDSVLVKENDEVSAGQTVALMTSMKMQIEITSPVAGKVTSVKVSEGSFINEGEVIIELE